MSSDRASAPRTGSDGPEVAVVVPSHDRPVRLRWLLNALAEQTLPRARWEVVVCHDSMGPETEELLRGHPLATAGTLRHLRMEPGSAAAAAKRNAAWRAARAPLIAFTDDDCRPTPHWLERALAAAAAHPGAILQGTTEPDPDEAAVLRGSPWAHTNFVRPPTVWAEMCNIFYPRELLERVGGLDPGLASGEDTDVALRALATGAEMVAAPELVVYHAVDDPWLLSRIRSLGRWQDMARVVKRHPQLRRALWGAIWWKREHAALAGAVLAATAGRRRPAARALALPWLVRSLRHRGHRPRGILRGLSELPGRAALDGAEMAVLARGSATYRTILL
jgi:GT2 family glycosyltransferase